MSTFTANKLACLHCPRAKCAGACVCHDGKPIETHAAAGDCPDGLFTQAAGPVELWGDRIARLAVRLSADRLAKLLAKLTGCDCGCPRRRRGLNELHRRLLRRRHSRKGS
jgi:hypothetical protein